MNFSTLSTARKALVALLLLSISAIATHLGYGLHLAGAGLVVGMAWSATEPIVQLLASVGFADALGFLRVVRSVIVKTANYQLLASDGSGTLFTTRGAVGAVTFTLPVPAPQLTGVAYEFLNTVDQAMTVSAGAGKAVTFNNAAAASLAASTAGQKIGAIIRAYCDGTSWHLQGSTVGVTYTVA